MLTCATCDWVMSNSFISHTQKQKQKAKKLKLKLKSHWQEVTFIIKEGHIHTNWDIYYYKQIKTENIGTHSYTLQKNQTEASFHQSYGNFIRDTRVNHCSRMSHNTTTLRVAKAIHQSPHRPFHNSSNNKSQEPKCWANKLAPAWVAMSATLNTSWNSNTTSHTGCSK